MGLNSDQQPAALTTRPLAAAAVAAAACAARPWIPHGNRSGVAGNPLQVPGNLSWVGSQAAARLQGLGGLRTRRWVLVQGCCPLAGHHHHLQWVGQTGISDPPLGLHWRGGGHRQMMDHSGSSEAGLRNPTQMHRWLRGVEVPCPVRHRSSQIAAPCHLPWDRSEDSLHREPGVSNINLRQVSKMMIRCKDQQSLQITGSFAVMSCTQEQTLLVLVRS